MVVIPTTSTGVIIVELAERTVPMVSSVLFVRLNDEPSPVTFAATVLMAFVVELSRETLANASKLARPAVIPAADA